MDMRPLGRTGPAVSALSMGTMTFGQQTDEAEAFAILDLARDHGVTFLDAAELYPIPPRAETQGETERIVGRWMAARGNRDRMVVATKVVGPTQANHFRPDPLRLDRANITHALERSLRNLQTDCVDLYYLHWPDRVVNNFGRHDYTHEPDKDGTPPEDSLAVLGELIAAGKIRHWGLSNETPWGVMTFLAKADAMGLPRPVCIQNPYSLVNRTFETGLSEIACRETCGLVAYSPLGGGVLTGKYLDGAKPPGARLTLFPERYGRYTKPRAIQAVAEYVALARIHGLSPTAMALAYVLARPFVTSAIVGATTADQLRESLGALTLTLSPEILAEIDRLHADTPNPAP